MKILISPHVNYLQLNNAQIYAKIVNLKTD